MPMLNSAMDATDRPFMPGADIAARWWKYSSP
jgi:hypothetical protein